MSWSDFFTTLSDEHFDQCEERISIEEKTNFDALFSYIEFRQTWEYTTIVSTSLFPADGDELDPQKWILRIQPTLVAAIALRSSHPSVVLRIYLDPRLSFASHALIEAGCEVFQMTLPTDGPNPGALWKYLALEEPGMVTTVVDAYLDNIMVNLDCNLILRNGSLKSWRIPMDRSRNYRPIDPNRFGTIGYLPARALLRAYLWFIVGEATAVPENSEISGEDSLLHLGPSSASRIQADWSRPDLEEHFLLAAVYPRIAFDGLLSVVETFDQHSRWLSLDIEYATWANPESELLYVQVFRRGKLGADHSEATHFEGIFDRLLYENRYPQFFDSWCATR